MDQTFGVESKNSLPSHRYWRFFSFFFHSNFIVLSSTLKFMVHFKFKLIFVWFRLRFFFFFFLTCWCSITTASFVERDYSFVFAKNHILPVQLTYFPWISHNFNCHSYNKYWNQIEWFPPLYYFPKPF